MTPATLYALAGMAIFGIGVYSLFVRTHTLQRIVVLNVMGSAVFLILIGLTYHSADGSADPLSQALVLTGIVVTISVTAAALALACRIQEVPRKQEIPHDDPELRDHV